jgi:RimJ/RimL family protein N-acetyltransferase
MAALLALHDYMSWERAPTSQAKADSILAFRIAHYNQHGFGLMGVWRKGLDGTLGLVGQAGLQQFMPDLGHVELAIFLAPDLWGGGHARRLARWYLDRALRQCDVAAVWATVRPENAPAVGLVQRLGFSRRGERLHYGYRSHVYRMCRADWRGHRENGHGA